MIYVMLADGFEDIEALEPVDILRRAELDVKTVGVCGKRVTSAHGVTVEADILIDEVRTEDMDMLVLPGGAGHTVLDESGEVNSLIAYAAENGIYIAAICASPSLLGKRGLLCGKKYTCFPGFEKFCGGGIFSEEKTVLDGKILTGKGAGAAAEFGFGIAEIFRDKKTADEIRRTMQY